MLQIIPAVLIAVLLTLAATFLVTWLGEKPRRPFTVVVHDFVAARIAYLMRLWRFAGPRLLDKNFLSAAIKTIAGGIGVACTDGQVQIAVLALTLAGTFFFAPWEHLPFENLEGESEK
jgi:hypothetical protein